ncbi:hypothetical protein KP509_18G071300 [Ceratopteris richardii]|nr:hypothetical protein KP509_18G071300 [Ceratopteris richardii]
MGPVDVSHSVQIQADDPIHPRPSTWAWKFSMLLWRRLSKRSPSKQRTIKYCTTMLSPQLSEGENMDKPVPSKHSLTGQNTDEMYQHYQRQHLCYYSSPRHSVDDCLVPSSILGCYNLVTSKARSRTACSGRSTPSPCHYSPDLLSYLKHDAGPYYQLRHGDYPVSAVRHPLYIVS